MGILATILTPLGRALRNKRAGLEHSVRTAPQLTAAPATIEVGSSAFAPGGVIPDRHASMDLGPNVSPDLHWSGVPTGTAQLLLAMEDIDAPTSRPILHLAALLRPDCTGFAEGALTKDNPEVRWVPASRGRTGYQGPRPLPGHGTHRYGFHVYALAKEVQASSFDDLLREVDGQVLASGFLEGVHHG
jgi:Raf kinase inhibitor-like YbhB/YbcL family protein